MSTDNAVESDIFEHFESRSWRVVIERAFEVDREVLERKQPPTSSRQLTLEAERVTVQWVEVERVEAEHVEVEWKPAERDGQHSLKHSNVKMLEC